MKNKSKKELYIGLIKTVLIISILISSIIFIRTIKKIQVQNIGVVEQNIVLSRNNSSNLSSRGETIDRTKNTENLNNVGNNQTESNDTIVENESKEENNVQDISNLENVTEEVNSTQNVNEEIIDTPKYISISEVKISQNMDLTVRTGLSRGDFINLIARVRQDTSGFFEQNAGKIYDLCEKYSLNEIFFCGIISAESGWDIASNHRKAHNYISLMSNGKLIRYSSVDEGLEVAASKLHTNYLTPGGRFYYGKTLSAVKKKFCPASSTWVSLVYGRMKQII